MYATNPIELVCTGCGISYHAKSKADAARRKYCTAQCAYSHIATPMEARFVKHIGPTTSTGCILWTGGTSPLGYGVIYASMREYRADGKRRLAAHRIAWERVHGPIPAGMHVLHRCDNPPCINTDHLWLGTHQENMLDRDKKNRCTHGDQISWAKLTSAQVKEIKERYSKGDILQKHLAAEYGVTNKRINSILRGRTWKRVS